MKFISIKGRSSLTIWAPYRCQHTLQSCHHVLARQKNVGAHQSSASTQPACSTTCPAAPALHVPQQSNPCCSRNRTAPHSAWGSLSPLPSHSHSEARQAQLAFCKLTAHCNLHPEYPSNAPVVQCKIFTPRYSTPRSAEHNCHTKQLLENARTCLRTKYSGM